MTAELATCRRPITPEEVPHLEQFGARLRLARGDVTQARAAWLAEMSPGHLSRLERGRRRPRASTIARLAVALAQAAQERQAPPIDAEVLALELADAAGPALAPESKYAERVDRRRQRRQRRWERIFRRVEWHARRQRETELHSAMVGLSSTIDVLVRLEG